MKNRIASLFELDELLAPGKTRKHGTARRRKKKARAATPGAAYPRSAFKPTEPAVAQSFDRGDPIRCQHGHPYRPADVVDVSEPGDAGAQSVQFEADYTVEAFEEAPDEEEEEDSLRLADIERESRLTSRESTQSMAASFAEPAEQATYAPRAERELPASFAAQMSAVENDLAELATRVQTQPPNAATPAPDESADQPVPPAPAPQAPSGHGVFDSMAKGMSFATEFRLPPVQLSHVFSALNNQLDADEKTRAAAPPASPAPFVETAPAVVPPADVLLKDLVALPRATEPAPTPSEVHAYAAIDVRHDVQLVPQLTGFSCWAAGAAMLVSWRDQISIDPSQIAAANGYWAQYKAGLHPEDVGMFNTWRLKPEPAQSYTIPGFAELLRRFGPLWVASAEPGPHIRVVTGIVGDGTPDGTLVHVADPWEQGMTRFKMPNAGSRYTETYRRFVHKQEQLARREMELQGIYVAHN